MLLIIINHAEKKFSMSMNMSTERMRTGILRIDKISTIPASEITTTVQWGVMRIKRIIRMLRVRVLKIIRRLRMRMMGMMRIISLGFNNPCRDIQLSIAVDKVYNYWSRGLQLSHCIAVGSYEE